ncbi:MAG: hypothetical protein C0617_12565 [Desulfuromonas sp.]|uniref:hypothetical protein n=1 Tax=Desulfuromonas sp. TaxID=892 RepID=UPI000CB88DDF|nr:hypothetical protein [Desulfuromonas sp.]PLX83349.1 MAG: hypothetical protein C0617_12565 [Desulfuromonas sp.]
MSRSGDDEQISLFGTPHPPEVQPATEERKAKNTASPKRPKRKTSAPSPPRRKSAAKKGSGQVPEGDVRLTANIREDLHLRLKITAATRRTTIGELIEELVELHL